MTKAPADTWVVRDPEPEDLVKPCLTPDCERINAFLKQLRFGTVCYTALDTHHDTHTRQLIHFMIGSFNNEQEICYILPPSLGD